MFEGLGNIFKLREALNKCGIGFLSSPEQIKIKGIAHAEVRCHEMLMIAQTEYEIQQIKQGKKQYLTDGSIGKLIELSGSDEETTDILEPKTTLNDFSRKIKQRKHAEEIQQEINVNNTLHLTEEELLKSQQAPSEKEIKSDWLHRWRDNAKDITNDELRLLWAKTLAGEVKSPGSYSLRTLEFMRSISQAEAQIIDKLGPFVAVGGTIFKVPLLDKVGIDFDFLLRIDELGIISGVENRGSEANLYVIGSEKQGQYLSNIINNNLALIIEAEESSAELKLEAYRISKVGVEVLSLGDFSANEEYMIEIEQIIKSKGFDVKIVKCIKTDENQWHTV